MALQSIQMHQDVVHTFESDRVNSVQTVMFTYADACKKHPAIYVDAWVKRNAAGERIKELLTSFRQVATTFPCFTSNRITRISIKEFRIHPKCS